MSLDSLKTRLDYLGGSKQQGRMIEGKLESLKKALLYSYQAATIVVDGKEFRALINPDKIKADYDNQILSIPYEDIQLNAERVGKTHEGLVKTCIEEGSTFYWKDTDSYWIVYLQHRNELAYFRAEIRRCEKCVEVNGKQYWVYFRGPVETTIPWNQKKGITWNTLNYSSIIYITKDENTLDYFHRFKVIKIDGNPWEVKAVDANCGDGIIEVQLGETFSNELKDAYDDRVKEELKTKPEQNEYAHIDGDAVVYPFDVKEYHITGLCEGQWSIDNKKAKIVKADEFNVTVEIITGKSGSFNLTYKTEIDEITLPIVIKSL